MVFRALYQIRVNEIFNEKKDKEYFKFNNFSIILRICRIRNFYVFKSFLGENDVRTR
jgi:hypothetical protein